MIKFCPNCFENHITKQGCYNGYYWVLNDDVDECWINGCGCKLINIDFPALDLKILTEISNDPSLYKAMINLHEKDIIEYELKMSQFRNQAEQKQTIQKQQDNSSTIKCPYCHSDNVKKITASSRVGSAMMFGILSKKIGKQWHCNDCKSDF